SSYSSPLIIYPESFCFKQDQRNQTNKQQHYPGHCRRISRIVVVKGLLIHVHGIKQGAVHWLSLSNKQALCKGQESIDHVDNQSEENSWRQERKGNLKKFLYTCSSVDFCCFI